MRATFPKAVESGRVRAGYHGSRPGEKFGAFVLRHPRTMVTLKIIAVEDGEGWDHVSVSHPKRCPTWDEMSWIKRLFFADDECVVQYHPAVADHINVHPNCLHLWRKADGDFPMPPKEFV